MKPFSIRMRPSTICGMPSGPISARMRRRQRQVGLELAVAEPHRQHQILGRQPLRLDVDGAVAVLAGRQRRAQQPGPLGRFRADRQRDAAGRRAGQAQIDVLEGPLLAVALVVDGEIAVLEADLAEVVAVEAGGAEPVDPGEQRGEIRNDVACCGRWRRWPRAVVLGSGSAIDKPARSGPGAADAVTNGRLLAPAKTVTLLSGSMRTCISAPTRLSRSARTRPVNRPEPETPTSAFGALATTVPSASRTTMSRMRSAVRPLASRSSCVPPTSTLMAGCRNSPRSPRSATASRDRARSDRCRAATTARRMRPARQPARAPAT